MATETLTEIDRAALERAIELTLAEPDAGRVEQVRSKLLDEDWSEVGEFCAYHRQCVELGLKPWEWSPSWLEPDPDEIEWIIARGPDRNPYLTAAVVLQEMLKLGISRFDPTPLISIDNASRRKPAKRN